MRSMIESLPGIRGMRLGQSSGAGTSGISAHWPPASSGRLPEGGVHGEDLAVADVADGAGLGDLLAGDRDRDVDVHDRRRVGVGQVLRGGPHHGPAGAPLEGGDGGAEPAAAEEELVAGGDAGRDGQHPAHRVVGGLEAEPGGGVHRRRTYRPASWRTFPLVSALCDECLGPLGYDCHTPWVD